MTRLIIFDLDGTLLDTLGDLATACNHALEMCGCPKRTVEEYKLLIGGGITKLFKGALPPEARTDEMVAKMRTYFLPYYREHICDLTRPYDGIEEMLDESFVKINQSCLGNVKKIARFDASIGGSLMVTFRNAHRDYVSRRQLKTVKERMHIKL